MTLHEQLDAAAAAVRAKAAGFSPKLGLILGSGLGAVADLCTSPRAIPFADIPHLGRCLVGGAGHHRVHALVQGHRQLFGAGLERRSQP